MAVKDGKVSKLRPKIPNAAAPALATCAPAIQKAMGKLAVKDGKVSKLRPKTP